MKFIISCFLILISSLTFAASNTTIKLSDSLKGACVGYTACQSSGILTPGSRTNLSPTQCKSLAVFKNPECTNDSINFGKTICSPDLTKKIKTITVTKEQIGDGVDTVVCSFQYC